MIFISVAGLRQESLFFSERKFQNSLFESARSSGETQRETWINCSNVWNCPETFPIKSFLFAINPGSIYSFVIMSKDNKRIATLFDNDGRERNNEHDHPHREGQAFYAGGSEHSGQQILGPRQDGLESNMLIDNLFHQARQSASDPSTLSQAQNNNTLPIIFWRNGFTIGDEGELREYVSPENRQFMDCLRRGETPPELASRVTGGLIDVKLENKSHQDYKPKQRLAAFSGEGHRLGAPSPETSVEQRSGAKEEPSKEQVLSSLVVDESQPTTNIQVRLVDNSRLVVRINLAHRVGDLVSHIRAIRPQYSDSNFVLATTFPAKELTDLEQTINDAQLTNASVLQKIKR